MWRETRYGLLVSNLFTWSIISPSPLPTHSLSRQFIIPVIYPSVCLPLSLQSAFFSCFSLPQLVYLPFLLFRPQSVSLSLYLSPCLHLSLFPSLSLSSDRSTSLFLSSHGVTHHVAIRKAHQSSRDSRD